MRSGNNIVATQEVLKVSCRECIGSGFRTPVCCSSCVRGVYFCKRCMQMRAEFRSAKTRLGRESNRGVSRQCPPAGLSITETMATEYSVICKLWSERGGRGTPRKVWTIDNPELTWKFETKRRLMRESLEQEPDQLEGFHGSREENIFSIASSGFDSGRRAGQVFGSGEYFAKCPEVSKAYCRGGSYMLICRLSLGIQAKDRSNKTGDHIWVNSEKYYVMANPEQVLPLYIVQFDASAVEVSSCPQLSAVLTTPGGWSSVKKTKSDFVPPNRPCAMSAAFTDVLWIGYLRPDLEDLQLEHDIRDFLDVNACAFVQLQIVRGKFTQAKVRLLEPLGRHHVRLLNTQPFLEKGLSRTVTVDDAHGSKGQICPRSIAHYCRGRNLRFVDPCRCDHAVLPTDSAAYKLLPLEPGSAKWDEIASKFLTSAPFHDGRPQIEGIHAIQNETLERLHETYRQYLRQKNGEESKTIELYHGTNNKILDVVYKHGLSPPSDMCASDSCPRSGGKGLCTSLCNNNCEYCVQRHEWDKCHMFGLGIYLGDLAQKSHRYCSQPEICGSRRRYRMVLCSVLMGKPLQLEAHLAKRESMHDVTSLRTCWQGDLEEKVELAGGKEGWSSDVPVEQHDLLYVKGLGCNSRPGFSVMNSEFVSFHPYQCLPRYEITYVV